MRMPRPRSASTPRTASSRTATHQMKNTIGEDKFKSAVSEEELKQVEDKVQETMQWLDTAEHAEKDEFDSMQKDLESVCNPIITKMYQGGDAPPSDQGMPGQESPGAGP